MGVAIWALSQIGGEEAGLAIQGLLEDEVSEDEAELIQQALEKTILARQLLFMLVIIPPLVINY